MRRDSEIQRSESQPEAGLVADALVAAGRRIVVLAPNAPIWLADAPLFWKLLFASPALWIAFEIAGTISADERRKRREIGSGRGRSNSR